jgi:hypothetical protein
MSNVLIPKGDNPTPETDKLLAKFATMMTIIKAESMINEIVTEEDRIVLELIIERKRKYYAEGNSDIDISNEITSAKIKVGKNRYIDKVDMFTEEEFEQILKYVQV